MTHFPRKLAHSGVPAKTPRPANPKAEKTQWEHEGSEQERSQKAVECQEIELEACDHGGFEQDESSPKALEERSLEPGEIEQVRPPQTHPSGGAYSPKVHLFQHLAELRRRLMMAGWALIGGTALGYAYSSQALGLLTRPLVRLYKHAPESGPLRLRRFIYTGLTEAFLTHLKMALFIGLVLATPVLAFQLWRFIRPALARRLWRFYALLIGCAPVLFVLGAGLAYQVICPKAWAFFLSFEDASDLGIPLQFEAKLSDYVGLTLNLMMGFGAGFQLPIALALAVMLGWVSLRTLRRGRKYAFLIITVVAAIATPPDLISPLGLMIPLYSLYELTLWGLSKVQGLGDKSSG